MYLPRKVLIGDTIFTSPTGDGTAILRQGSSEPREGPTVCSAKAVPSLDGPGCLATRPSHV